MALHGLPVAIHSGGGGPDRSQPVQNEIGEKLFWTRLDTLIRRCDGALVLALARNHVQVLQNDSGLPYASNNVLAMPTVYNHLEGALALAQQLPLLIVQEENMDRTGIFNSGIKPAEIPVGANSAWVNSKSFTDYFDAWSHKIADRRDVFLGYCSKANSIAKNIRTHLEAQGFSVLDWARDFKPAGVTIFDEIERAARRCRCAIFLFTKDDELEANAQAKASFDAVPRDNVLLEAGYFTQARGKDRVAIVREKGAKMPADLGRVKYLSLEKGKPLGPLKAGLVTFLTGAL